MIIGRSTDLLLLYVAVAWCKRGGYREKTSFDGQNRALIIYNLCAINGQMWALEIYCKRKTVAERTCNKQGWEKTFDRIR